MLYPIVEFALPTEGEDAYNTLPSGNLGVFPITLPVGGVLRVFLNQLIADRNNLPQDLSLRGWISTQKGGNPVIDSPSAASTWTLSPLQRRVVVIYDMMDEAPLADGILLGIMPGAYWLNVLNLVNEANSFTLAYRQGE
jgi:hypothetical protein